MTEKTIVDKAGETVGVGIAMASDVAGAIKTAFGAAVTTVSEVLKKAPEKKVAAKKAAKKAPVKKAATKKSTQKTSAKKVVKKAAVKKMSAKKAVKKSAKKTAKKAGRRR